MKIIFGATSFDIENHAKQALKAIRKREERDASAYPVGIAVHLARFSHICEDCCQTYWDTDEWGSLSHVGCKGTRKKAGF